jgi:prolyl oligopeptidase
MRFDKWHAARTLGLALFAASPANAADAPSAPVAPVRPVTDSYFGTPVVDPYRWMETGGDELLAYMKAQDAVTRQALAPMAQFDGRMVDELHQITNAAIRVRAVRRVLDTVFFLEIEPGRNDYRLMTRAADGTNARLLLDPATLAATGSHAAIDYFEPSPDGRYVAVGVSLGGSENSVLHVIDVASGKLLEEAITRAQAAEPSWSDDNAGFYFARLRQMEPGAAAATKYDDMRVFYHRLGTPESADRPVFGPGLADSPDLPRRGNVFMRVVPGTGMVLAAQVSGVVETPALWLRHGDSGAWVPVLRHEDGLEDIGFHGSQAYVLSKTGPSGATSNGEVASFDLAHETYAQRHVLIKESDLVLSARTGTGIAAAQDALYVHGMRDGLGVLLRVGYRTGESPEPITLPFKGSIDELQADPLRPGVLVALTGWVQAPAVLAYDPATRQLADTGLQPKSPVDMSGIRAVEVQAASADGTLVPLTVLYRKDLALDGSHPTLLTAYGAYGVSITPAFSGISLPWLERGGIYAVVHARGGGERGEAWHLAGMKTTKQHTIDDFVAGARYLIDHGYTSAAHLGIEGTSAGGIAVGGFLTQHPELVGAVLYRVGITDILRSEQRATGAQNAWEYGTVKNEAEFRAMLAISPYAHVRDGTRYPAVLLETGANDPRVTSWMLTKMTARLQAANASTNPILLRVDFDAGHGLGSDRDQALRLLADEYTFLGWRLGMAGIASESSAK